VDQFRPGYSLPLLPSVVQTFGDNYDWNIMQTGLAQLAISVGALIRTLINPLQDLLYLRTASKNNENSGKPIPEA
jgi:hypothetical protein